MISNGYAKANNELIKSYNPWKEKTWIIGLSTNNLYGHSIMQLLSIEILN